MAGITGVVFYQWTSYWRQIRRPGNLTAAHHGIWLVLVGLILFKYVQMLRAAALELTTANTMKLEGLLAGIFLAWMFPLVGNAEFGVPRDWLHLPLSFTETLGTKLISVFIPMRSWVIVGASIAMFYPSVLAPNHAAGVAAVFLFLLLSYFNGLTASNLSSTALGRKLLFLLLLLVSLSATATVLLKNRVGANRFSKLWLLLPSHLVGSTLVGSRPWTTLSILLTFTLISFSLTLWSLKHNLLADPSDRAPLGVSFFGFSLPGGFGGLVTKDLRHYRRLLDVYFGLLVGIVCDLYLISAEAPSLKVFWLFMINFFLFTAVAPFNFFGPDDGVGFDRYTLMPLSGRMIILSKNLGFVALVGVQLLVMLCLACWRCGLLAGLLSLMEAACMTLSYMAWGNWMSINHPRKMQLFRFSSDGPLPEALLGVAVGSLPGAVNLAFLINDRSSVIWKMVLILLICLAAYWASLVLFGSRFEAKRERIKQSLA